MNNKELRLNKSASGKWCFDHQSGSNWNSDILVFCGEKETEVPVKKNSQSKGENSQQSQHCVTRDSNPGYTGGRRVALATSLPLPPLLLNFVLS